MHPKAAEKLQNHISGALQQCLIADSWPVFESYHKHVESLAHQVLKNKKEWITIYDVYSIFVDHVYKSLPEKTLNDKFNGKLVDILGKQNFENLVQSMLNYFLGIPRNYKVYFPLPPLLPLSESVEINPSVRIERITSRKAYPGTASPRGLLSLSADAIDPPQYFLVLDTVGYCGRTLNSSAPKKALSSFKIAMQQALARGIFKAKHSAAPIGLELFALMDSHKVKKYYLVAADQNQSATPTVELALSMEICKFLDSHELSIEDQQIKSAIEAQEFPKLLVKYFETAARLHLTENEDTSRVKIASEWAFDAFLTDSLTMSFIQTCIALEALYGDDNASDNLTQTLADRCAYLLGSTIKGRRTIKESFKELYKIRSKIVHGCVGSLAPDEEKHLSWGKSILELSIFKEIKHSGLDKKV